jgi:hypothetical protein
VFSITILESPWLVDDREWFAAHPDRTHRVRPAFPGEVKQGTHVVVRQIAPSLRKRIPFSPRADLPVSTEELNRRDIFGWATFDLLSEAAAQGRAVVPPAEIGARILMMVEREGAA